MAEWGGCLYDYDSHVINLVQFILGNPDRVSGSVLKKIYSKGVDDAVYATLLYDNGLSGQLSVNWSDETYRKMSIQILPKDVLFSPKKVLMIASLSLVLRAILRVWR